MKPCRKVQPIVNYIHEFSLRPSFILFGNARFHIGSLEGRTLAKRLPFLKKLPTNWRLFFILEEHQYSEV